ncbi:hypothetical protein N7466_009892 [Penicillium verhagenii]|uniref:uncharacterized protein n=1 Tax=Penicillium verhagenii TaxID=1562060 RepID=UPI0025456A29|nr:uncharacterized protein N7466_009892 [Penicillium verhagenii]KAJ5918949.1 hypothetical protein N7466_009892 [Penicillium verhagenii]
MHTTTRHTRPSKGAPSAPGLPDTLRNKITLPATAHASSTNHPTASEISPLPHTRSKPACSPGAQTQDRDEDGVLSPGVWHC